MGQHEMYIQSFNGWKIYQYSDGTFFAFRGGKRISGAMSVDIIKQTIVQNTKKKGRGKP